VVVVDYCDAAANQDFIFDRNRRGATDVDIVAHPNIISDRNRWSKTVIPVSRNRFQPERIASGKAGPHRNVIQA
jgi:hypothetical protein